MRRGDFRSRDRAGLTPAEADETDRRNFRTPPGGLVRRAFTLKHNRPGVEAAYLRISRPPATASCSLSLLSFSRHILPFLRLFCRVPLVFFDFRQF